MFKGVRSVLTLIQPGISSLMASRRQSFIHFSRIVALYRLPSFVSLGFWEGVNSPICGDQGGIYGLDVN